MTIGGRTGGTASQAPVAEAVPKQHGDRRSGPRTTNNERRRPHLLRRDERGRGSQERR